MRILMIGADPMEFRGVLRHATGARPAGILVAWSRTVRLGSHEVVLAANGAGGHRAAAALDAALEKFPADALVSTGFCGALAPELAIADVVVGTAVATAGRSFPVLHPTSERPHHMGVVCSIDHVAQTADEKRCLRAAGGSVVEMEAGGVAEIAHRRNLPFYCVRVVTDLAGEDLINNFNQALRPDGRFATIGILRGALRRPWVCFPELFRLRHRCVLAAQVLGDFFADCRF